MAKESRAPNGSNHLPAGYSSDSDDDYDDEFEENDYMPRVQMPQTTTRLMSPPEKLTLPEISDEERRRYMRDSSMCDENAAGYLDDSMYKTPNDTVLRNMTSFQSGDPVSLARQVRHLHNRVKLLEDEIQTHHNRQIFIFGIISVYLLSRGLKWMCR